MYRLILQTLDFHARRAGFGIERAKLLDVSLFISLRSSRFVTHSREAPLRPTSLRIRDHSCHPWLPSAFGSGYAGRRPPPSTNREKSKTRKPIQILLRFPLSPFPPFVLSRSCLPHYRQLGEKDLNLHGLLQRQLAYR